jgi:bifunctional N-acetylglucosamine-1-phosphate-uridyltransferase/glucosamine-1-phosphate-acetyltransferase GlmU-like protein
MTNIIVTILAGGMGKRMQSELPKVLHKVHDTPMLVKIIEQVNNLNNNNTIKISKIIIVVGKFINIIKSTLEQYISLDNILFAIQSEALGTGNAILSTLDIINGYDGINLILNGDCPKIKYTTIIQIINNYIINKNKLQITAIELDNPFGSGRIILDNNVFEKIVEEKDCSDQQKQIKLINCGIYLVDINVLQKCIPLIGNNNIQKEYYLTDIVEIYKKRYNDNIGLYILDKEKSIEIYNVNTKEQLNVLNAIHLV